MGQSRGVESKMMSTKQYFSSASTEASLSAIGCLSRLEQRLASYQTALGQLNKIGEDWVKFNDLDEEELQGTSSVEIGSGGKVEKESDDRNTGDDAYHHQPGNVKKKKNRRELLPKLLSPRSPDN